MSTTSNDTETHNCEVCGTPGALSYCPDCGSGQGDDAQVILIQVTRSDLIDMLHDEGIEDPADDLVDLAVEVVENDQDNLAGMARAALIPNVGILISTMIGG